MEQFNGLTEDYWSLNPVEFTESRAAVAEARENFGNPEEMERPPLEAVTRGLVKITADREHSVRALVNCKVCELTIEPYRMVTSCKCPINANPTVLTDRDNTLRINQLHEAWFYNFRLSIM
jgi:hypothetical protein